MKSHLVLPLVIALITAQSSATENVITNFCGISEACRSQANLNRKFEVSGHLISYYRRPITLEWIFTIAQGERTLTVYEFNGGDHPAVNIPHPHLNDFVRLSGVLYEYHGGIYPGYTVAQRMTPAVAPPPIVSCKAPGELFHQCRPHRLLRITGTIRDFFRDESDPGYIHMSLVCGNEPVHVMILQPVEERVDPSRYVGATATVTGIGQDTHNSARKHVGHLLLVSGIENIDVSDPSQGSIPDLDTLSCEKLSAPPPTELVQTEGDVLCVWLRNQALLRTPAGNIVKVKFLNGTLPHVSQKIRARGIPETDLYFLNLANASWEPIGSAKNSQAPQDELSPRNLLFNAVGYPMINIRKHGQTIRLSGVIRYLPRSSDLDKRFHLESDGCLIPIDIGANAETLKNLVIGSKVSVTGVFVLDIDSYGIGTSIPQARGFFLVLRTPKDLVVLSRPSWWTPVRLLVVIGALILLIAAILVWNVTLRRLAERRGKELADEQVNRAVSDLKVYERTHLAVELHDSLSQTLSGVSMQIDAVGRFAETDRDRMHKHLGIAAKTLKSCRDELRNCLTDLRSSALEEWDMNEAIRQTLEPYSDDAAISTRFFIPREILSDSTAHTILRIIRELVVNAIRHGHADKVRVAGTLENGKLLFSVSDNGCGFDTESVPGLTEGHFGLQGIRERVDGLDGNFEIESKAGQGSKATVSIVLPSPLNEEKT